MATAELPQEDHSHVVDTSDDTSEPLARSYDDDRVRPDPLDPSDQARAEASRLLEEQAKPIEIDDDWTPDGDTGATFFGDRRRNY